MKETGGIWGARLFGGKQIRCGAGEKGARQGLDGQGLGIRNHWVGTGATRGETDLTRSGRTGTEIGLGLKLDEELGEVAWN